MDRNLLSRTAAAMVARGKGLLAADESSGTCEKRFKSVGVESNEPSRRAYRDLLFTTRGIEEFVSGVILFDETIRQSTLAGNEPFPEYLAGKGIIPGIKVDRGIHDLALWPGEKVTEGLDGLRGRLEEYFRLGARFAKWRAVITIGPGIPTHACLYANAHALARYSACPKQAGAEKVAEETVRCLKRTVPAALPGIVFLSGGQSDEAATAHLNEMARMPGLPWPLTFSYSRALQTPALKTWCGVPGNVAAAQRAFYHRARMNSLAAQGKYRPDLEKQAA